MKISKKILCLVLMLVLCLAVSVSASSLNADNLNGSLVILHTSNINGAYETNENCIGIAGVKSFQNYLNKQGADVLLFDSGDFSQGNSLVDYYKGDNAIEYMIDTDYDCVALGDKNFNFGFTELLSHKALFGNKFIEVLSVNIMELGTKSCAFDDYSIFKKGGKTIGVFGIIAPEISTLTKLSNLEYVNVLQKEETIANAQKTVDILTEQGCDYIIALTHLLTAQNQNATLTANDIANEVTGINLIVDGGNSIARVNGEIVNGSLVVSSSNKLQDVGMVVVTGDTQTATVITAQEYSEIVGDYDKGLTDKIAEDKEKVEEYCNETIANSTVDLVNSKVEETALGDFVADAFLYALQSFPQQENINVEITASIISSDIIENGIKSGDFTTNDLLNVTPNADNLVLASLTGMQIQELLEEACQGGKVPQVAGIKFTIDTAMTKTEEYSPVEIQSIGVMPFDYNATYTIVIENTPEMSKPTYGVLKEAYIMGTGISAKQAIVDYVEHLGGIIGDEYSQNKGRISVVSVGTPTPEPTPIATIEPEHNSSNKNTTVILIMLLCIVGIAMAVLINLKSKINKR